MGIFEKIEKLLGFSDDLEEKEIENEEPKTVKTPPVEPKEQPAAAKILNFKSDNRENSTSHPLKFVKSEIRTISPKTFIDDAHVISDYLRQKIAVVVNFEKTDIKEAARIADFVFGTVYAIDGKGKQIGSKVFIFAPDNVTIEAYEDEKKSKGTFID